MQPVVEERFLAAAALLAASQADLEPEEQDRGWGAQDSGKGGRRKVGQRRSPGGVTCDK